MKHKMIARWVLVAAALLAVGALMTGIALARTGSGAVSDTAGNHSLSGMSDPLDATMLSGGRYQLITTSSPVNTQASGGRYRLMPSAPAADPGSGCCCKSYLPCVRK